MNQLAIEKYENRNALAVTEDQLTLAKNTVAKGLDDNEFALFTYNCHRQGIHPLDGLLVPIKRKDTDSGNFKLTFVTTVDLLRSRAADTNEYAGSDDAIFQYREPAVNPQEALVTVWRFVQGVKCSFSATARWSEYYPGDKQGFMWKTKPHVMLGKCAEGLALRKAFPKQLAGLYLEEELQQQESGDKPPKKAAEKQPNMSIKCPDCNAEGGHLPNCKQRQQTEAKPKADAKPKAEEKKVDPKTPEATFEKPAGEVLPGTEDYAVFCNDIKQMKTSSGNPYLILDVVGNDKKPWTVYCFHQGKVREAMVKYAKGRLCRITVSSKESKGVLRHSLEHILEIGGVGEFVNDELHAGPSEVDDFYQHMNHGS